MCPRFHLGFLLLSIAASGASVPAQLGSGTNHFLAGSEQASGAESTSPTFRLHGVFGGGVAAGRSGSTGFAITGGFVATLDAPHTGRPWVVGALPRFAAPRSQAVITLHGTDLLPGAAPRVEIGGVAATVLQRSQDRMQVRIGFQDTPGWQPVTVSGPRGTTTLVRGLGVLPMLMTDQAPAPGREFGIVFKGSPNDRVIWAISPFAAPPIPIPGVLYGLGLHPAALLFLPGFVITSPDGEFRFPVPPTSYTGSVQVQAVFLTANPGYGPASFSNVLTL